jgi:hypothetical protein
MANGEAPILLHPFVINYVLPLVLVFTLVFAILEKTQLLGKEKRQINAIVALVVGIILIASPANYIVVRLMPFLAVALVILFVFMLAYGFLMGKTEGDVLSKGLKITFGIILGVALVTFLLYITGYWDVIYRYSFGSGSGVWFNVLLVLIIIGAVVAVLFGSKGKGGSSS